MIHSVVNGRLVSRLTVVLLDDFGSNVRHPKEDGEDTDYEARKEDDGCGLSR